LGSAHDEWIATTPHEQVNTTASLHRRSERNRCDSTCERSFGEDASRRAKVSGNPAHPAGRRDPQASTIAQAIAVAGDRIIAVGSNDAMAMHVSPATLVIDLKGKTVVPGLTDGHAHMDRESLRNVFPSLGRVRSIHDIQDRIAELARIKKPGE
jgi:hypothetical protein